MDEQPRPKSKAFRRMIGVILLLLILLLVYAVVRGGVSSEQKARLRQNEQRVAELQQKYAAERIASRQKESMRAAIKDSVTTMSTDRAAAQEKCDELFKSIFDTWNSRHHPVLMDDETVRQTKNFQMSLLPKIRELAALYDSGVRVSAKAKIGYCNSENANLIEDLSYLLMESEGHKWGKRQSSEEILKYLIPAAKFERVIDMPQAGSGVTRCLQQLFDPDSATLKTMGYPSYAYPKAFQEIDLELLAPRRAWDWREQTPNILEYTHAWADDFTKRVSTIRGTYDYVSEMQYNNGVAKNILNTALYLPFRREQVEVHVQFVEDLTANAENIHSYQDFTKNITQTGIAEMMVGGAFNQQAQARLTCAGLQILRGEPIPAQVTPDSYFYDPYRGQKVNIEQIPMSDGNVRVRLSCSHGTNPQAWNMPQFTFILPSNHPALKNLK